MPLDNDKLKKLYSTLQQGGYTQDYNTFVKGFTGDENYKNRKQVYDLLTKNGAKIGSSYEEFMQKMQSPSKPTPNTQAQSQRPAAPQAQQTNSAPPASTPKPAPHPVARQSTTGTPLTEADKMQLIADKARNTVALANASSQRFNNRVEYLAAKRGLQTPRVAIGEKNGGTKIGQSANVVVKKPKFNAQTGKMEQTFLTESGNEYTDRTMADMEQHGIDEYKALKQLPVEMSNEEIEATQQQANGVVEALWKEAEDLHKADREKNAKEIYGGNPWLNAGREMHVIDAGTLAHKNRVSHMTRFDLEKMMDNAWSRVGKKMTAYCYAQVSKQHPNATEQQLRSTAEAMARQLSDNAVYKYAVKQNAPKNTLDFFVKTAGDMNLLNIVEKGMARSEAGTTGDLSAYEAAMGEYGKNHRFAQIGGTVAGMMFDPITYVSGGIGSLGAKGALNLGARLVAKKAATNVGARLLGSTLAGRVAAGVAGGAANLATYEGLKEGESQFLHGGHINATTGENEGYSATDILKSAGRGMVLGSVTGAVSPILGNVADKVVKTTSSTAGKVAVRVGELAVSTVAEGTIFSIPEWVSGEGDAMDVWTDNMAMMLGFKAQHIVKSAPRVIAGLRPIENPRTMQERNHNRMSFEERLRNQMDASPDNIGFTQEERDELKKAGYGDLESLFTRSEEQTKHKKKGSNETLPDTLHDEAERLAPQNNPEFDGYEAMERLMQDRSVSQSARAKAYYILTGRMLPASTITGYTTETDEEGNIFVKSVASDGQVVTSRRFTDEASVKKEQDKIMRQAELNSVDMGERYKEMQANIDLFKSAIEEVVPGADFETVIRNYKAVKEGDKHAIESYGKMFEAIEQYIRENAAMTESARPEGIRAAIKEETGVNVDSAIKKEYSKRTQQEQAAVEDYLNRLYPEKEHPVSEDEAEVADIYDRARLTWEGVETGEPEAQADFDAIRSRMIEAYELCEQAFGTEVEMRMAEMQENPWDLVNDPSLTVDQKDAVLHYIKAKAAMDGVTYASLDAMENKREEIAKNVEQRTHKDYGTIQPATMKVDDKPVYIVKGNVVMYPDGSGVDVVNSDESIVIYDVETGEFEITSPDQIYGIGEAIDPQTELDEAYANIEAEHEAMLGGNNHAEVQQEEFHTTDTTSEPDKVEAAEQSQLAEEQVQPQTYKGAFDEAIGDKNGMSIPEDRMQSLQLHNQQRLEEERQRKVEDANRKPTALSRIPIDEETGEPAFERADRDSALDALYELTSGNEENVAAIVNAQVEQSTQTLEALKKKQPKKKTPALKGSPMAMIKAQQDAEANHNANMEQYQSEVAAVEERLNAWSSILALMNERQRVERENKEAAQREQDAKRHDEAVAKLEEEKRIKEQKAAEQAAIGVHAVSDGIKNKWNNSPKIDGSSNALTLPDGSTIKGHYVLTESGAATPSHDVHNGYEPTEGFPIDENNQSVNDRDYKRDPDAQRMVRDIADNYDSRALQSPVIVSQEGIVLSGNNRTMSGEIAAEQGSDVAYIDYLRDYGHLYGFTTEQVDGMKHPRVVFVLDEKLPYDATTFARFNAESQKKQSKPEHAVKLGKVVPDNVFNTISTDISRFDRLSDYYADEKAVSSAISLLLGAGVINEMQLPELRTGNTLSAAGRELIENTLIGKVFQNSPDAVRLIISTPTLRHAVFMGLNEIANNRMLADSGYDLIQELGAAIDLVSRAKTVHPDIYKEGMPVSPFGREQGLFDDEYGDSRITDGTTLILADILNSGKPSDLRKLLSAYNAQAVSPAGGQLDMFTGRVTTKEEILTEINNYFKNATPKEQQALVDAAIAERKQRAESTEERGGGSETSKQTANVAERDGGSKNRKGIGGLQEKQWNDVESQAVSHDEAIALIAHMEKRASIATSVDLTIENWDAMFGKDGIVKTPIGEVKMGDNQFTKMLREGRSTKLGMVKPTLENPDVVLEDASKAKDEDKQERPSSYIFIKAFKKSDDSRFYYFASVTVSKAGKEVVISNQEKRKNAVANLLSKDKLVWKHADDVSDASDVAQGLYSSQGDVSDLTPEGTDAPQTNIVSESKGKEFPPVLQEKMKSSSTSEEDDPQDVNDKVQNASYIIAPSTYTNKKGKTSNVSLLKFNTELTPPQERAIKEFAKERVGEGRFAPARGWKDRESGGWIFRNEEDAKKAAEIAGNEEAVANAQPLTAQELRDVVLPNTEDKTKRIPQPANRAELATQESAKEDKKQYEISDEEVAYLESELRAILGIGEEEGDAALMFRNPDELTAEDRQKLMSVGQRLAMSIVERGHVAFADYASMMVKKYGNKVRPWLKAFYGGLEYIPGYEQYNLTPHDELRAFDVENFDKPQKDSLAQANMIVEEGKAQVAADKATLELKTKRNEQRKANDEQTAANTTALASKTETLAGEAEALEKTSRDEPDINRATEKLDEALNEVGEQLALLGYYEGEELGGHIVSAEKEAVEDAMRLANKLAADLGLSLASSHGENENSKTKALVVSNITPVGGDVSIHLPLAGERELYVYIGLEPATEKSLIVDGIMFRVDNLKEGRHEHIEGFKWLEDNVTYQDLIRETSLAVYKYIPARSEIVDNEYKVGDKVEYSSYGNTKDAIVAHIEEDGSLLLDTGHAPIMWVTAQRDQLRHKTQTVSQNEDIFQKAKRIAEEAKGKRNLQDSGTGTVSLVSTTQTNEKGSKTPIDKKTSKKDITPEQPIGDLFEGLLEKNNSNELLRNDEALRSEGLPANSGRQRNGLREGETTTRKGTEQKGRGLDGGREGQSIGNDRLVSSGLHGLSEPKNRRNNHSERGVDHAPTSINARIEANIKAIELAQELLESGEPATPEQMSVLRQFSGWGGLGAAFNYSGRDWKLLQRHQKIRELLGQKAYEEAVMSANSAYYTPAYVVDTLWDIAEKLGFQGGNILEGSAGIGNILGQMPTAMSERSAIHAIEIDGTSGGILSLLYPDAKVDIQGFESTHIPNGSVDLAITNVPFVTGLRVNDTTGDSDLSKRFHNIHDFCIAKNVRKLREGGIGIFISSNGTLDNSKALRDWVVNEGNSDFIGAFRMNNKTFGGTTVTSDIIVIRKRVNGQLSANAIDVSTISGERVAEFQEPGERKGKLLSMDYNKYFIDHPERMAGEMRFAFEVGETFRPTSKGLYPVSGKSQEQMLQEFVQAFSAENFDTRDSVTPVEKSSANSALVPNAKEGSLIIDDNGNICKIQYGVAVPMMSELKKGEKSTNNELIHRFHSKKIKGHTKQECFAAYTAIKEALADVMRYQIEHEDNEGLKPLISKLNKAYDNFVGTYGHFHKNNQLAWLRNDVDYPNVFSLEIYKEQGDGKGGAVKTYEKADVMKGRVVEKETEPQPENIKDGVVISMFKSGRIDVPYIAEQLGISESEVKREIIESGLGFEEPTTRQVAVSYQYLSGNVREKLQQAIANNQNGEYDRNIKALQAIMPMNIPAHLIDFTLGSSWLDSKLYDEYVKERTGIGVHFTAVGGTWFMKAPKYGVEIEQNRAMGVVSEMLHKTIMGHELIEAAIQNKTITVSKTEKRYDGSTETLTDREATAACAAKIDEIRQDFKEWARQKIQSNTELSARIEREYNDRFNNYVPMSIPEEFVPEFFGGATHKFKMRPHQGKAIVRGTMQPLLLAHEVGTGKTYTLISTAMEMRRLGTARKPMIVVQNATVGQFVASAKELYPNAKILTLEDDDRSADGRKNFYAKIKYNDWDMIVVPQSTFEFIPDSEERQMAFIQDKIEEKMLVLESMKQADGNERNVITRNAEKEIENLKAELATLTEGLSTKRTAKDEKKRAIAKQNAAVKAQEMLDRRTDDVENFDDMGIDALLVDEAHEYKHLGFATAMQRGVKGVDPSYSKKSQGVYLKTQAVLERNNGRNVIFATGTPISNTAAEIWTFMRYLMPKETMKEYGIYYFDDFVRNFGNIQQMLEFSTSGKYKENNRFAGYVNLPELVRIWSEVADTVPTKSQKDLVEKIPTMEGGKAQDIYLPQTRALRSVMKFVRAELERYEEMSGKEKKANSSIPLTMYGIAQRAAVDARLVEEGAEDDPNSKTNEAVRQTLRSLRETNDYKGTIAIFADHYQNKRSGFNLYDDIKKKLVAQGVPASEIVVIKPGMTIKKKLEIFEMVNRGEIRVILGSTATLGTGVNIQERLHTLIHLDAPNRPMDYTQRNGRILRQGNLHKEWDKPVRVLRFGVEDSLDVTAYQRLKTKGAIADSIMEGEQLMHDNMTNRVLEEAEDVFGDTVAQLSGSEYAMLKNNAEKSVRKYESRKKQWEADQAYIHNAKPKLEGRIKDAERMAEDAKKRLTAVQNAFPNGAFSEITIGKQRYSSIEEMGDFIKEHNKKINDSVKAVKENHSNGSQTHTLTLSMGGFDFIVTTEVSRKTVADGASLFADTQRKMTYSCKGLGLKDVPVKQSLLRNAITDITENVITGKDFGEQIESAVNVAQRGKAELEQLKQREGKPFEYENELEEAKRKHAEYSEAMKKEMEEKEKKYAEMDASVEASTDITVEEGGDVSEDSDKYRLMDEDRKEVASTPEAMVDRVNSLSEQLHTPVRIISTPEEVAALPSVRQRRMKGSFNTNTGEVTIVIPNNSSLADVENTFMHEVVGHGGFRVLFPEQENLDNAIDELYRVSDDGIRESIDRAANDMYEAEVERLREQKRKEREAKGEDANAHYYEDMADAHAEASKKRDQFRRNATEEYGADLAGRIGEHGFEKMSAEELTFWGRLKSMLQKALRRLLNGLKITSKKKWSDKEWAFVLHEAYKRKKNGGNPTILDVADTEVMKRKTGFDESMESREIIKKERNEEFNRVNERFNEQVVRLTEENADKTVLSLGRPSVVLQSAGVKDMPMKLYGNKVMKKMRKHGFALDELRDLPKAVANPITVFNNYQREGNRSILTELKTKDGVFLVTLELGKNADVDFNIVSSVFGKGFNKVVDWYNKGFATYIDKEKALSFLSHQSAPIAATAANAGLSSASLSSASQKVQQEIDKQVLDTATKIVENFENPKLSNEFIEDDGIMFRDEHMGLEEAITEMKVAASRANADSLQAKQEAMKAIGGNLSKLRQAMARQKEYDRATVKSVTDLAKILLNNGLLDDLSKHEVKRLLSTSNNVLGKQDVSNYVQNILDIMVDNQLRMGANHLGKLLSIRASRVDARGIEVQGKLDPEGQQIAQVLKKAMPLPILDIEERISNALDRMGSNDSAVANEALIEYNGLLLARSYAEAIVESKAEEKALRDSLKEAKEEYESGNMTREAYREYVESTKDAIRQNKIERIESYRNIVGQISGLLGESVERAKQWREDEKRRVAEIHHNANSDMEGRPANEHYKESTLQKISNNSIVRFLFAPLATFDQMLRLFGDKNVKGEGYLWNRYMRGWVDATEKEYTGYRDSLKILDEKVSEIFGKKRRWSKMLMKDDMTWSDLYDLERELPKGTVKFWDGGEMKEFELAQGNLLYIYMVNKMSDGRMKLRKMGITDGDIERIEALLDPRFIELADWIQEEFLVQKRNEYNEVHKRMFGTSMAAIDDYFPLKILANARIENVDVADETTANSLPGTSTGGILKRRRNNLALDITNADAFSVLLDHVQEMEHWAAFAEFNRDLNTLLSYKRFRNQVMNMASVYGGGKTLWKKFRDVCSMAAGSYRPLTNTFDKAAVNMAKGVTASKVNFRVFTALKQFLSMPAYLSDSDPRYLAMNLINPIGAWKWAMKNLPIFEKRWKSRMAGDPRLLKNEMDWKLWQSKVVEISTRIGMTPNAFVDALTVSIGAHSMYQTKKQKYLRYGYDEDTAEKRAKQDATILFNQTQQSSESAFLSTMQVDRTWLSVLFTIFRNSSMSYTRQLHDAVRNLKHRFEPGYTGLTEEFMAKQMYRDGIDPGQADRNAKNEYRRALLRDIARVAVFWFILPFAWNLGAKLPYLILGDDDEEKEKMLKDAAIQTSFGGLEGLTGGDVISSAGLMAVKGEGNLSYLTKDMPLASDVASILKNMPKDRVAAMNDVINLLAQTTLAVNPQSLTDGVVAIMDYCGDDPKTSRECALLIMRIMNCPQSQIDKVYFDELGVTASEAQKMTPAEIAERYARYKVYRSAPLTGWTYTEEERSSAMERYSKGAIKRAKEKLKANLETEETKQLLSEYDKVRKEEAALNKLKSTDIEAYAENLPLFYEKNDMAVHERIKQYKQDMKTLTEEFLRSKSAKELDEITKTMFSTRDNMLKEIRLQKQQ